MAYKLANLDGKSVLVSGDHYFDNYRTFTFIPPDFQGYEKYEAYAATVSKDEEAASKV